MKRTTVLKADGPAGRIEIEIRTSLTDGTLLRDEHTAKHDGLVEEVHKAMTASGCYAHKIRMVGK